MAKKPTDKNVLQGVNWNKYRELWKAPDNTEVQNYNPEANRNRNSLFHVSRIEAREGISEKGLIAHTRYTGMADDRTLKAHGLEVGPDEKYVASLDKTTGAHGSAVHGVWVTNHPEGGYGEDIYEIRRQSKEVREDPETEHSLVPHDIPNSDVKRVGHFFRPKNGRTEIHWHRKENCDGRSVNEG